MNYSFYGGRRGASFIIAARFNSEAEMIAAFKQGGNYTAVNYDEFVIIDTPNKNDKDNGKIYRRGYNYQDNLGGAQYQGQIVGPSGMSPQVEMMTYDEVILKEGEQEEGYNYKISNGAYAPKENFVPGLDDEGNFNDEIKWACCSVRDNLNKDTIAYVGFKIPYMIFEWETPELLAANEQPKIERTDDLQHPFYQKLRLSLPKGMDGDTIEDVKINTKNPTESGEEGSGNQKLAIKLNNETEYREIGGPINYIMKTAVSEDNHLLALYSDPERRKQVIANNEYATYNGRNDWHDLGPIEGGVLIGAHFDTNKAAYETLIDINKAIEFLNTTYPTGLNGKIVTVGTGNQNKMFYGFNAADTTWYYLGQFSEKFAVAVKANTDITDVELSKLPIGGMWFVEYD